MITPRTGFVRAMCAGLGMAALAIAQAALATPVATISQPGLTQVDVLAGHTIVDSGSGAFADSFDIVVAGNLSLTIGVRYSDEDAAGLVLGLASAANPLATWPVSEFQSPATQNYPFITHWLTLTASQPGTGNYTIHVDGLDLWQEPDFAPYTLSITAFGLANADLRIPEPGSALLGAVALAALAASRRRRAAR